MNPTSLDNSPLVIPSHLVIPDRYPSVYSIRLMEKTLKYQGQIEPLQVKFYRVNPETLRTEYMTHALDAWGAEICLAARNLGWPTLLIHITERYEP